MKLCDEHSTIHPTGTCFEDVTMEFARRCYEEKRHRDTAFCMVHGICTMREGGEPYAHAWIEEGDAVWFSGIIGGEKAWAKTTREEFYKHHGVQERTRYHFGDLMALAQRIGNEPPPWEDRYRRLCRDYKGDKCGK